MNGFHALRNVLPKPIRQAAKRRLSHWVPVQDEYARQSFSQEGEDLVIHRLLEIPEGSGGGFYIDVGAHHPRRYSNTYFFYKMGWTGINIDALPGTKALFDKERPRDVNVEVAVAETKGELLYYRFNDPAVNGFDRNLAESRLANPYFKMIGTSTVPASPLREVLATYLPDDRRIDFLSVDVEGLDLQVLRSNDWKKFRPRLVLAEDALVASLAEVESSPITLFMESNGYVAVSKTALTLVFAEKERLAVSPTGIVVR